MDPSERKSELRTQTKCVITGVEKDQPQSPVKAIRAFCEDCYGGAKSGDCSINQCCSKNRCPLWPFRFGKNPYHSKADMTDEQKQEVVARFAKGHKDEDDE